MATFQDLRRFRTPPQFRGRNAIVVQLWWFVQATLFRASPQIFFGWRRFLLRLFGAKIGKRVLIRSTAEFTYPWKVSIGDYSWIGDRTVLYSLGEIHIGQHTVISQQSYICTGSHDADQISFDMYAQTVHVGDECWVASGVFIMPGATIGDGAVIGARSTVFGNIPGGMICYGNPARPVRRRRLFAVPEEPFAVRK